MSQFEHDNSSEYIQMSPVARYYNDVNVVRENLTSAILAVMDLVRSSATDGDAALTAMLASEMMPMEWEMENDIVIAKEKLAILPLHTIARDLEDSRYDLDDLKEWYRESLRGIRMITNDIHTNACLQYTQPAHKMCDYSTVCPRRYSQQFLLLPAMAPDFSKDIYKTAPKREFTIVKHKLNLAMSQELIKFDECEDIKEAYELKYNTYMSTRTIESSDYTT